MNSNTHAHGDGETLRRPVSDPEAMERAAELLMIGRLVAFPTDTVYGLGADPRLPDTVAEIYVAKGRPPDKAIPLLVSDLDGAGPFVARIPDDAYRLIEAFWPGGLTLVLPIGAGVPPIISHGPGIAVRMPDHPVPLELIRRIGGPLAATSANRSGSPDPTTAAQVMSQLGRRVDLLLDGGATPGGKASTVIDLTRRPAKVLRLGAIGLEKLRGAIDDLAY